MTSIVMKSPTKLRVTYSAVWNLFSKDIQATTAVLPSKVEFAVDFTEKDQPWTYNFTYYAQYSLHVPEMPEFKMMQNIYIFHRHYECFM